MIDKNKLQDVYKHVAKIAMKHKVAFITAQQPAREGGYIPQRREQQIGLYDVVIVDYSDLLKI